MATYDYEKILADYGSGRMDVAMTLGHALQHIGQLYAAQNDATARHQDLRKQITALESDVKILQSAVDRLQKTYTERLKILADGLASLQDTITGWQASVSSQSTAKPRKR